MPSGAAYANFTTALPQEKIKAEKLFGKQLNSYAFVVAQHRGTAGPDFAAISVLVENPAGRRHHRSLEIPIRAPRSRFGSRIRPITPAGST